uniref:transglycosylase SLT domain-containing protein n=1 Tax=Parendozoicomonas sp. Alg238-R29 TaxID=2993446 RepID=UPI00248E3794
MRSARLFQIVVLVAVALGLVGCASTTPPRKPHNLCAVFKEKPSWHRAAKKASKRWGTPVQVMMAIMYQESSYRHDVRPPRPWFLFIPLPRNSSAYGYAQAQDGTWDMYLREVAPWFADRDDFEDAIDFIGWYTYKSREKNGV